MCLLFVPTKTIFLNVANKKQILQQTLSHNDTRDMAIYNTSTQDVKIIISNITTDGYTLAS